MTSSDPYSVNAENTLDDHDEEEAAPEEEPEKKEGLFSQIGNKMTSLIKKGSKTMKKIVKNGKEIFVEKDLNTKGSGQLHFAFGDLIGAQPKEEVVKWEPLEEMSNETTIKEIKDKFDE